MALTFFPPASWSTAGTTGTNGSYKDVTFTGVAVGDRLVVGAVSEGMNNAGWTRSAVTQSGTTSAWTAILPESTTGADCDAYGAYATASSSGTIVVRVQLRVSNAERQGACGWLIPAAEWNSGGTPVVVVGTSSTDDADGQYSAVLPGGSTYIVLTLGGDWNASAAGTGSSPAGATNNVSTQVAGAYTVWARSWTAQASGTRNYGPAQTTTNAALSGLDYTGFVLAIPEATGSGAQTVIPTAVATGAALGTPTLTTAVGVAPSGVATGVGIGTPAVSTSTQPAPAGIPTAAALGTPTVSAATTVSPSGVASAAALGTPSLTASTSVTPTAIPTGAAVGTPTLSMAGSPVVVRITEMSLVQGQTVGPTGVASAAAPGTPTLSQSGSPVVVRITEMSLAISVNATPQVVVPAGVPTAAALGAPAVSLAGTVVVRITEMSLAISAGSTPQIVAPAGIPTGVAVGTPTVTSGVAIVRITEMVLHLATSGVLFAWQERAAGVWVDPDWVVMERRAGVWVPLDG